MSQEEQNFYTTKISKDIYLDQKTAYAAVHNAAHFLDSPSPSDFGRVCFGKSAMNPKRFWIEFKLLWNTKPDL